MVNPPLILASTSPYRAQLLEQLGVPFTQVPPKTDETSRAGEPPTALAERLSIEKAAAIEAASGYVIGSDQVVDDAGTPLGKPTSLADNVQRLAALAGRSIAFETAVCLRDVMAGTMTVRRNTTIVRFRKFTRTQIQAYVDHEQALDCALGLKFESSAIQLVESISSDDPSALMGLPLISLWSMLRDHGFS